MARSSYETFTLSCQCVWCRKTEKAVDLEPHIPARAFIATLTNALNESGWNAVRINDKIVGRICPSCYVSNFANGEDDIIDEEDESVAVPNEAA